MKFSYSAIWDDTVNMFRGNASLLMAIAGVFLFLPALVVGYAIPQTEIEPGQFFEAMSAYLSANWPWLLLANVVNMMGAMAMLLLLLGRQGQTVGQAIVSAFSLLPAYFLASILFNLILLLGALALLVPAFYLFGRLAVIGPVIVAEERNPLRAIARSFQTTRNKGWAIFGLFFLVAVAGVIVTWAVTAVLGSLFLLALGERLGGLLVVLVEALAGAVLSTILVVLSAAVYRRIAGSADLGID